MNEFMDRDFLLTTQTARHLYHDYAAPMPLVDYHCHINPQEIFNNRQFSNLTEIWLGGRDADGICCGDHYKWRLMRANGVPEDYITGSKPAFERFLKFVETLEMAIGNPMVHWCNLELQQFFGFHKPLTLETARECWDFCNDKLRHDPSLSPRGIIAKANVAMIGTTDDPVDTLEWHEKIAADPSSQVKVYPSFRPDKALNITSPSFGPYIGQLAASVGKQELTSVQQVCQALEERLEFFRRLGCRASDHGMEYVPFRPCTPEQADVAFHKAIAGETLTREDSECYQTYLSLYLGKAYSRMNIVMQLHYSCLRNINQRMFNMLGPDSGYDAIAQNFCIKSVAQFLSALDATNECPKTILYSLSPIDNTMLDVIAGCFQSGSLPGKIQHGAAWWFNDTKSGMEDQMKSLASLGLLGNFVGMLTDSRSFLSYARHDYFRRILCNLIGNWVENGEYPAHEPSLKKIVEGICYKNAVRYFCL